jgi:hypothetical protein
MSWLRYGFWMALVSLAAPCADTPIIPHTVCEILHDLASFESGPVAALGRYSFRNDGRWLNEQACAGVSGPPALRLTEDPKDGPKAPGDFELDGVALNQKLAAIRKGTTLGKFRFGSTDYDRWAVVYGTVQPSTGAAAGKATAELRFRGDGVVVFLMN